MTIRAGGLLAAGAAVVAAALCAGALAVPAQAATDRYAIGDSVMLGAAGDLKDAGFRVDATESRQAYKGPALVRSKRSHLPTNVVVHLGTNGTYPLSTCKALVKAAGPDRRVFLVTVHVPRSWKKANNRMLRQCDAAFAADRVHVIDWDKAASSHPAWLYSDHIHLKPAGSAGFARLIDSTVDDAIAQARVTALANAAGSGHAGLLD